MPKHHQVSPFLWSLPTIRLQCTSNQHAYWCIWGINDTKLRRPRPISGNSINNWTTHMELDAVLPSFPHLILDLRRCIRLPSSIEDRKKEDSPWPWLYETGAIVKIKKGEIEIVMIFYPYMCEEQIEIFLNGVSLLQ